MECGVAAVSELGEESIYWNIQTGTLEHCRRRETTRLGVVDNIALLAV